MHSPHLARDTYFSGHFVSRCIFVRCLSTDWLIDGKTCVNTGSPSVHRFLSETNSSSLMDKCDCGFLTMEVYLEAEMPGAPQSENIPGGCRKMLRASWQTGNACPSPSPAPWVSPICTIDWFIRQQDSHLVYLEPSSSKRLNPASLWFPVFTSRSFQSDFSSVHLAYRTQSTYLPTAGDLHHVHSYGSRILLCKLGHT